MASSRSWYSLTELCCDTWRQQKNSLEKKTSHNISYQVGKSVCVYVCICAGQERKQTFTSRLQRAVPELEFLVLQLALQVLRENLSRLHETCGEHQGWLPPKHSHAAPITRSFQGLSQRFPIQLKMRLCSCCVGSGISRPFPFLAFRCLEKKMQAG